MNTVDCIRHMNTLLIEPFDITLIMVQGWPQESFGFYVSKKIGTWCSYPLKMKCDLSNIDIFDVSSVTLWPCFYL